MFALFEGIDTVGKTTQIELLKKIYPDMIATFEPGNTKLGREIRDVLLTKELDISKNAELMLFLADRAEHYEKIISKNKNKLIVSDRGFVSGIAYALANSKDADINFLSPQLIHEKIVLDSDISDNELRFYVFIAIKCQKNGFCDKNDKTLSSSFDVTSSAITRYINKLVKKGYLIRKQKNKQIVLKLPSFNESYMRLLTDINLFVLKGNFPDKIVFFKTTEELLRSRINAKSNDKIEQRGVEYLLKVQENMEKTLEYLDINYLTLNAGENKEDLHKKIKRFLDDKRS